MYQEVLNCNGGVVHATNMEIFNVIGTGRGADYILSHVDMDLGSRWEVFSKSLFLTRWWYKLAREKNAPWALGCISVSIKSNLYLLDIVKDVTTIWILTNLPTQPVLLISVGIAALTLSELVKALHMFTRRDVSMARRVGSFLMITFMPVLLDHQHYVLENELKALAMNENRSSEEETQMTILRKKLQNNRSLFGELRSIENTLENATQILVPFLALNLPGYALTDTESSFMYVGSFFSAASLVSGQVILVSTRKNGQLGIMAMLLLLVYTSISVVTRGYLIYSSILAALKTTFECSFDGCFECRDLACSVKDWSVSGYVPFVPIITALIVLLLHVGLSFALQMRVFTVRKNCFVEALWSLLAPPLNMDWDTLFTEPSCRLSINECWDKSKRVILMHNLITFAGNLAIVAALLFSEGTFDPTQTSFLLVPTVVSPFMLISLGYLYFVKYHPWARLLNSHLSCPASAIN